MSGHNKWSKVKHQKAATDAKKSKIFGQLAKVIASESKKAGGNPDSPGLKAAVEKAKKENMPKDNIERAIAKGQSGDAANMEAVRYEAYGPGGAALIIEGTTDNTNRALGEVKTVLTKNGGSLAEIGAAAWAFTKEEEEWRPHTTIPLNDLDSEKLNTIVEALEELDDIENVYTNAE